MYQRLVQTLRSGLSKYPQLSKRPISFLFLILGLSLAIVLIEVTWYSRPPAPAVVTPVADKAHVQLFPVQRADVEQTVSAAGKLQLFKYADVGTRITGQVSEVFVAIGDEVHANKLLLNLAPTFPASRSDSNDAQLARYRAELSEQQAQLDFAELQFKRQTQLKADNATREETYEASRAAMYTATARVEAIKAQIRQTESVAKDDEDLRNHTQVTAPMAGTVISVNVRQGQMVNPSQSSQYLIRIADLSRLTVQARVAETDVPRLHSGMNVYFTTPAYPGKRWYGKLRQILPTPADGTGEQGKEAFYNVLFEVNNPDRLLMSGMSTNVNFVLASVKDVPVIPLQALPTPGADGLYAVNVISKNPQQTSIKRIKLGLRNQQIAQVVSGLEVGDKISVNTAHLTTNGMAAASTASVALAPAAVAASTVASGTVLSNR